MSRNVPFRPSACALALAAVAATALTLSSAVYATRTYNSSHSNTANQIVAHNPCGSPNNAHDAPLSIPSCSPPQESSSYLTVAPPNANGKLKSIGSVRHTPVAGDPTTPQNEADIAINVRLTDVRCQSASAVPGVCNTANTDNAGLPDYSGELNETATIRITDNNNGGGIDPATVLDFPFAVTVACVATSDTNVGSTCALATSVNAVVPSAVIEGKNTAWELSQIQTYDGGADGTAATGGNTLFQTGGIWLR